MPVALAALPVTDRLTTRDAQTHEFTDTRARVAPAFPVAHAKTASDPLIELVEQFQLRGQTEVTCPATEITPQLAQLGYASSFH